LTGGTPRQYSREVGSAKPGCLAVHLPRNDEPVMLTGRSLHEFGRTWEPDALGLKSALAQRYGSPNCRIGATGVPNSRLTSGGRVANTRRRILPSDRPVARADMSVRGFSLQRFCPGMQPSRSKADWRLKVGRQALRHHHLRLLKICSSSTATHHFPTLARVHLPEHSPPHQFTTIVIGHQQRGGGQPAETHDNARPRIIHGKAPGSKDRSGQSASFVLKHKNGILEKKPSSANKRAWSQK
jgi:hypothetical protein